MLRAASCYPALPTYCLLILLMVPRSPAALPLQDWSYTPEIFRLFYCTGWDSTVLHYRRVRKGQPGKVRPHIC